MSLPSDVDETLCECPLAALEAYVSQLERQLVVTVVKPPSVCMTMIRAEDTLDKQEFFLGEALTSECEVSVKDHPGYGVCLGDEPVRAYCQAVIDAVLHGGLAVAGLREFLEEQAAVVRERNTREFNLVLQSHVDFKLMEEE